MSKRSGIKNVQNKKLERARAKPSAKSSSSSAIQKKRMSTKNKKSNGLYPALASKTAASSLAADLLKHFKRNPNQAQRDMINLFFRCSGLTTVHLQKQDDVEDLDVFMDRFKSEGEYLEALKEDIRVSGSYPMAW